MSAAEAHAEAVIDVDVACVAMKKTRTASSWLRFQCYRQPTSDLFGSTKSRPPCAVGRACCGPYAVPAAPVHLFTIIYYKGAVYGVRCVRVVRVCVLEFLVDLDARHPRAAGRRARRAPECS